MNEQRQPDDFGFDEDASALKDVADRFFREQFPSHQLHQLVASETYTPDASKCRWDRTLWQQVLDMGWLMINVPESAGGLGMSMVATTALIEAAGKGGMVGPLLPTFSAASILSQCSGSPAETALSLIAEGNAFSYAGSDQHGSLNFDSSDVAVKDQKLNGQAFFVQDAQKVDYFLVNARFPEGYALVSVPSDAEGLRLEADAIIDLTRDQATLSFDQVSFDPSQVVCAPGEASLVMERSMPALLTLLAADVCGAAEWQLQTTAEYARTRRQFERDLGFFQAVKHPLVEFMCELDIARGLLYNAACAIDHEPEQAAQYARMAAASAFDAASFGSNKSVQLHGGIGFTWECYVHIYFKRQLHSQRILGDANYQRAKLAELLVAA